MQAKTAPNGRTYLNIGCGTHYSPDWNNIDLNPQPDVIGHDVTKALPFEQGIFDAVYSSHVLEHLTPPQADFFLHEQYRVLKKGGQCRIAVPDLEKIVRDYLARLEEVENDPSPSRIRDYQWTVLQLLDQQVREETGGETLKTLKSGDFNPDFVRSRCGDEFAGFLEPNGAHVSKGSDSSLRSRLRGLKRSLRKALRLEPPARTSGEVHRWMYDRLSLRLLMSRLGFENFAVVTHWESQIPDWDKYRLDTSLKGAWPRKPDSIFVEASKPG
jgi:predicted SAM-dependent methyltransferase